uniref:Uncharacterized protein n=1 Tax=Trichobilharzia regenti TaxID=157069 RepID=A0AA85JKF1_TRIRE|nr:unnamed protein product [Trichobilharzia regenti]
MDNFVCCSCVRRGKCTSVLSVKCTSQQQIFFCQDKECIHYFLPLNFPPSQCHFAVPDKTECLTINSPIQSEAKVLSSSRSGGQRTVSTDSGISSPVSKNIIRRCGSTEASAPGFLVDNCNDSMSTSTSTSHSRTSTTYSHYKRSVLLRARRQADNLRFRFLKERRTATRSSYCVGSLLSAGLRFL